MAAAGAGGSQLKVGERRVENSMTMNKKALKMARLQVFHLIVTASSPVCHGFVTPVNLNEWLYKCGRFLSSLTDIQ
jgi:uncharacterized membrane protein